MKQTQKIVRVGNYYQIQSAEEGHYPIRATKKEQSQTNIYIPPENLITQLPSHREARSKYFMEPRSKYSTVQPDHLLQQLQDILANQKLADTDKQEILKLIKEIKMLKEQPLVPLTELKSQKANSQKAKEQVSQKLSQIDLKIKVDLRNIEQKVQALQKFSYPDIINYEHQLQVLLGEKKPLNNSSSLPKDDRNKEEVDSLFTQLSNLSTANNLSGLVDKIYSNNGKYSQINTWAANLDETINLHTDFLAELKQDELLLSKLQENFNNNVKVVKQTIEHIKKSIKS